MSAGINKVTIVGNLGRDPEVRFSQSGNAVCKLNVAVTERRKEGDSWKDHTEWVRCVCFGKTAENAGQYLQKGRQVYVEGRLQTSSYKDKDGVEKYTTEVIANQVLFLGSGGGAGAGGGRREDPARDGGPDRGAERGPPAGDDMGPADTGFIDDDLPF